MTAMQRVSRDRMRSHPLRCTAQLLAPAEVSRAVDGYVLHPTFPVAAGSIRLGYDALAGVIAEHRLVRIDGYVGVQWSAFRDRLTTALGKLGVDAGWIDVARHLKKSSAIEELVQPFLGGDDPLFGTRFTGELADFYDQGSLQVLQPDRDAQLCILYGCGAGLVDWEGALLYLDLPKNELQFRSRAGAVYNLGCNRAASPKDQYKRFYFVDWPTLNRHKAKLLDRIDWLVDEQRPEAPTFVSGQVLRTALDRMSQNVFRARPWFEPGPWGGQWLKSRLAQLPRQVPNYAWSFELISPENGITLGDQQWTCEVSFDWLMYRACGAVLGESAERFGHDFPIRFDFLDTVDGGNLSLQCHPRPEFTREEFGEPFTQDETYYIVDCKPGAVAYLGFRAGVDPAELRECLESSERTGEALDVDRFVQSVPIAPHDLLLIPSGTIHCSGVHTLVLEISATPYIFTFKMYDWQRLGLDGVPRPLNIERAFRNLCFERQGEEALRQLISRPRTIEAGADWQIVHLPTHHEHFYDIHRIEFDTEITLKTQGSPHVLMLVEGTSICVETAGGMRAQFNFIETFIVPAAAGSYKLINLGVSRAKVVKAFIKPQTRRGA